MIRNCILLTGIMVLFGCSEVYQPEIETVEPFLVVEGNIRTKPGTSYVYLSNSRSYNEDPYFEGIEGATVIVSDDEGNTYVYERLSNGVYGTFLEEGNTAVIGRTYTLYITTADGKTFESTPQKLVQSPPLRNLFCEYDQQSILSENTYGEVLEITYDGMNVIAEADGVLPSDNYYLYNWLAYEEQQAMIQYQPEGGPPASYDIYRHRKLSGKYSNIIHTANADLYNDFRLRDEKIMFISSEDLWNYAPIFPDTFTLLSHQFDGLLFRLEQYSVSPEAYTFYNDIEKQLAAAGHLFDPISPQITGNISCTNDESVIVVGVFYATDIAEKYSYLYINHSNRTYAMDIDSFPELWLDTCSWGRPEGWILPPF